VGGERTPIHWCRRILLSFDFSASLRSTNQTAFAATSLRQSTVPMKTKINSDNSTRSVSARLTDPRDGGTYFGHAATLSHSYRDGVSSASKGYNRVIFRNWPSRIRRGKVRHADQTIFLSLRFVLRKRAATRAW
jgi:hypothetical protein